MLEARVALGAADEDAIARVPGPLVVIGGPGLLSAGMSGLAAPEIRTFDDLTPPNVAAEGARRFPLGAELVADARLVVLTLPKALAELDEITALVAAHAHPEVFLLGAARDKHMTHSMNATVERHFDAVHATRGRFKSRALVASGPRGGGAASYPRHAEVAGVDFAVYAHGAAFAGPRLDIGTRALLDTLDAALRTADLGTGAGATALDLGTGTGVLATALARRLPDAQVIATDRSWAAAASATASGVAARVNVDVRQEDAAASVPDGTVDLVLLNPPFHDGHAVVDDMAEHLFRGAARVLRRGGALITVFNSHLRHRAALERIVGPTEQLSRTPKFTVTRSIAR